MKAVDRPRNGVNPFIQMLVEARKARGISQVDLGRALRRPGQQVNKWERGLNLPSMRNLENWCAALGLRLTAVSKD